MAANVRRDRLHLLLGKEAEEGWRSGEKQGVD